MRNIEHITAVETVISHHNIKEIYCNIKSDEYTIDMKTRSERTKWNTKSKHTRDRTSLDNDSGKV